MRAKVTGKTDVWIHAVSVGEMMIAEVLMWRLREMKQGLRIVVSTKTAPGFKVARKMTEAPRTVILCTAY